MSTGQIVWCVLMAIFTVGFVAFWGAVVIDIYRNTDPGRIRAEARRYESL